MAKPLGPKSLLIREAITAHPDKGNTEIAELLNDSHDRMDDKIKVKAQDVAQQRQAMKKGGAAPAAAAPAPAAEMAEPSAQTEKAASKPGNGRRKGGKKPGRKPAADAPAQAAAPQTASNPLEAAQAVKALVERYGAETVKGLADLFGK